MHSEINCEVVKPVYRNQPFPCREKEAEYDITYCDIIQQRLRVQQVHMLQRGESNVI